MLTLHKIVCQLRRGYLSGLNRQHCLMLRCNNIYSNTSMTLTVSSIQWCTYLHGLSIVQQRKVVRTLTWHQRRGWSHRTCTEKLLAMFASLCNSVHYCQYLHHQHSLPTSSWVPTLCVCRCALCVFPAVADIVSVAFTTLFLVALLTTTRRMITAAINRRIQRRLRIFQSVTVSSECQPGLKRQLLT